MAESLIKRADRVLAQIGMPILEHPVFYNCPVGLRFEISEPWGDTNSPSYFLKAFTKAHQIYCDLADDFDILRIDLLLDAEDTREMQFADQQRQLSVIRGATGLPFPTEMRESDMLSDAGEDWIMPPIKVECYWDIKQVSLNADSLLKEIIHTDFPEQGGEHCEFESSVFLFSTSKNLMFHLYDDRGLDLVAQDIGALYPFYQKYNEWILHHDRKRIERIFSPAINDANSSNGE